MNGPQLPLRLTDLRRESGQRGGRYLSLRELKTLNIQQLESMMADHDRDNEEKESATEGGERPIGYRKPPRRHRFRKGKSGFPLGGQRVIATPSLFSRKSHEKKCECVSPASG
jgi:hypothetical protein